MARMISGKGSCKRPSSLVNFKSGSSQSQIDYVLVRRAMRKLFKDVKVIAGEECTPQHRLMVGDLTLNSIIERPYATRRKVWKLKVEKGRQAFGHKFRRILRVKT